MEVEITPEPTPDEREAVLRALAATDAPLSAAAAWWEAGVREAAGDDVEDVALD